MSSLNWVMLSPSHSPIPLPSEKFLLTLPKVSLSLFAHTSGSAPSSNPLRKEDERKASKGSLWASNKRVVYVVEGEVREGDVKTLSCNWEFYTDGRYVQPWFGATYYEALILPSSNHSTESGITTPHVCRFYFNESGGYRFYEVVEGMKARLGSSGRGTPVEPLPLYEPPSDSGPPETSTDHGPSPLGTNSVMEPSSEDLDVARVAQEAQQVEEDQVARNIPTSSAGPGSASRGEDDGPPGYEV